MMSTQPALAAHASVYHNYGLTEVLFGRAAENFTGTLASITLLQNTMELSCYDMLLGRLSSELQLCSEEDKMECTKMYVCWFAVASVSTYQFKISCSV